MIDTFTLKFNEAELEIISSALADYRDYAESDTDPILARCNSIDDKIAKHSGTKQKHLYDSCLPASLLSSRFA